MMFQNYSFVRVIIISGFCGPPEILPGVHCTHNIVYDLYRDSPSAPNPHPYATSIDRHTCKCVNVQNHNRKYDVHRSRPTAVYITHKMVFELASKYIHTQSHAAATYIHIQLYYNKLWQYYYYYFYSAFKQRIKKLVFSCSVLLLRFFPDSNIQIPNFVRKKLCFRTRICKCINV